MKLFNKLKKSLIVLILAKGLFHGSIIVSVPPSHFFYQQNYTQKKEIYKLNFWKLSDFGSFQFTESEKKKDLKCQRWKFLGLLVSINHLHVHVHKILLSTNPMTSSLTSSTIPCINTNSPTSTPFLLSPTNNREMNWKQGVCHIMALPFTLKYILRQKKRIREIQIFYHANI